jgi:hypothetical protein
MILAHDVGRAEQPVDRAGRLVASRQPGAIFDGLKAHPGRPT